MAHRGDGLNDIFENSVLIRKKLTANTGEMQTEPVNNSDIATKKYVDDNAGGVTDHGALTGLADDDHTQYAILAGRTGGQDIWGGANHYGRLVLPNVINDVTYIGNADGSIWLYCNHDILLHSTDGNIIMDPISNGSVYPETDDTIELGNSSHDWKKLYVHDIQMHGEITGTNQLPPVGSVLMYVGTTAPSGWFFCDGSAKSESTYAALFAVIGHTFGGDPGGSNFNLPNIDNVFPKGSGTAGGVPGGSGGSTSYTPTGTIDSHTMGNITLAGMIPNILTGPLAHTFTGNAATIEPPYLVFRFIIKY